MVGGGAVASLVRVVQGTPKGVGEDVLLPNALAALHNCSLLPEALGAIVSEQTSRALLPHVGGAVKGRSTSLARRAAALLSKCCTASKAVATMLAEHPSAVPSIAKALVAEAAAMKVAQEAAAKERAARERAAKAAADAQFAKTAESADDAAKAVEAGSCAAKLGGGGDDDDDAGEDEGEEAVVGALVRILTACAPHPAAAQAICDAGGLPVLVGLLKVRSELLQGNAALGVAECAKDAKCLAVLAMQDAVPPLLAIAHEGKGQAQKNAAIALGRLAKNAHCLQAIRDNHGIEILARAMKDKL
eukprot:3812551-Prymnesium_polylepis.1